jgi:glycerol-3-phosphate dehydrogenase
MLDWLIIGGGIHGTHLALVLAGRQVATALVSALLLALIVHGLALLTVG